PCASEPERSASSMAPATVAASASGRPQARNASVMNAPTAAAGTRTVVSAAVGTLRFSKINFGVVPAKAGTHRATNYGRWGMGQRLRVRASACRRNLPAPHRPLSPRGEGRGEGVTGLSIDPNPLTPTLSPPGRGSAHEQAA